MNEDALYSRSPHAVWRTLPDSVLILSVPHREVFTLDGSGRVLWRLLAEPLTLNEASAQLAEEFGVPADVVGADIAPLLDDLADRHILTRVPAT